ncbi:MAG TPA: NUDIX hydrolase [Blastocatellia bacterium]|nr:NUDIX hydrolase [Blastocatellia bacterium]
MNLPTIDKTEYLYRGRIIDVSISDVHTATGLPAKIEMVHHPGGAGALPLLDDGSVILVRQYRYPIKRLSLEIPAGRIEHGQSPLDTARRELEEETGYIASKMYLISAFFPTPGYCEEKLFVYLATDLTQTQQNLEFDEDIELVRLTLDQARSLVYSGEIDDAKTIIALLQADRIIR